MDSSSMWLPELISTEIEDHGLMSYNDDKMIKSYDSTVDNLISTVDYSFSSECYKENDERTSFHLKAPSSFEEQQVQIKCPINQKASNYNNICERPKTPLVAPTTHSSSTFTISFGDVKSEVGISQFNHSLGFEAVDDTGKVQTTTTMARGPVQAQDHVLAERKRREKLNQHFIAMSALLPNLKKLDKASVLEDAANHIRELQDRVKELEGLSSDNAKDAKESVVIALKKSRFSNDDGLSPNETTESGDRSLDVSSESSAEIEVRMSGNSVLIRIHHQKNSSLITKVLSTIHKIGLSAISSSVMPFANTATLIMIAAQIEDDFFMTATDLVRYLQQVL